MRGFWALVVVLGLLATAMYFVEGPAEMNDLEVFHRAGARFLSGEPLYRAEDGHFEFKYLPVAGALFVPLGLVPLAVAKPLWLVLLVLALGASMQRIFRAFPSLTWQARALVVFVLARSFEREFANGQLNALLLALTTFAFAALEDGQDAKAGALAGLAILIKPHWLVLVPYFFLTKRVRAGWTALAVFALGLALPVLRYGASGTLSLHQTMSARISASTARLIVDATNVSLPGFFAKVFGMSAGVATTVAFALALGTFGIAAVRLRGDARIAHPWNDLAILAPVVLLLSPQAWEYTVFSAACAFALFVARRSELSKVGVTAGMLACLVVAADAKVVLGTGAVYKQVMRFSPNMWALVVLAAIALTLRPRAMEVR